MGKIIVALLGIVGPYILRALISFIKGPAAHCWADNKAVIAEAVVKAAEAFPKHGNETLKEKWLRHQNRIAYFGDEVKGIIVAWCKDHKIEFSERILNGIREIAVDFVEGLVK